MQNSMVRVSKEHPFKSLKGRVGLVVLESETTALVLFQFGERHNQMSCEIDKTLLQIVEAPRIEEHIHYDEAGECYNEPVQWELTMGPPLRAQKTIRMPSRENIHNTRHSDESFPVDQKAQTVNDNFSDFDEESILDLEGKRRTLALNELSNAIGRGLNIEQCLRARNAQELRLKRLRLTRLEAKKELTSAEKQMRTRLRNLFLSQKP